MPIFYDDVLVSLNGILTVQSFVPPRNGRTVKFSLPGGYERKCVYTCIDGNYSGPYTKAAPIETDIHGWELLKAGRHVANVIVVDMSERVLNPININFDITPVLSSSGERVVIHMRSSLRTSIRVKNGDMLIMDYMNNGIVSAERRAESVLADCLKKELNRITPEYIDIHHILDSPGLLGQLSEDIRRAVCQEAEGYLEYPWFTVLSSALELMPVNLDELVKKDNHRWEVEEQQKIRRETNDEMLRVEYAQMKMKLVDKTADALLSVYKREPIPEEITQLLVAFVQSNPGVQTAELIAICEKLQSLSQSYSPERILKSARQMGFLPVDTEK